MNAIDQPSSLRADAAYVARVIARARDTLAYEPQTPKGKARHPADVADALRSAREAGRMLSRITAQGFTDSQRWCTSCWRGERGDHGGPNDLCTWCESCCDPDLDLTDYD